MKQSDHHYPSVSFIIPTLNAGRFLSRCLKAISEQDYPKNKIEIIVADAYSTDNTRAIAREFGAKVINNPKILHEPGKTLATKIATGKLLFYTDADNILATKTWLRDMVRPYQEQLDVLGFLPQTVPPPDSSSLNRYLGYLFTDPLTWFIYGPAANPHDYKAIYRPLTATALYDIYRFEVTNHPLFGLSQGVGVASRFKRGGLGYADDILSGIQLIKQGGLVAYVPKAQVYHYHVESLGNFVKKYRWRARNNLNQKVKGMGLVNRLQFFNPTRRLRAVLFIPYSLSMILPTIDAIRLAIKWRDLVMFWHLPACLTLSYIIISEYLKKVLGKNETMGNYGT